MPGLLGNSKSSAKWNVKLSALFFHYSGTITKFEVNSQKIEGTSCRNPEMFSGRKICNTWIHEHWIGSSRGIVWAREVGKETLLVTIEHWYGTAKEAKVITIPSISKWASRLNKVIVVFCSDLTLFRHNGQKQMVDTTEQIVVFEATGLYPNYQALSTMEESREC